VLVEAERVDAEVMARVRARSKVVLGLNRDLSGFFEIASAHERLSYVERVGAGRLLRSASMTENIIKTICGTNTNWGQAVKMINRIGQLGSAIEDFRNLNVWPSPREILRAGRGYLVDVARVGYRADAILALCRDAVSGAFDPEGLDEGSEVLDTRSLRERVLEIRGVGPASAGFLLALLGHFDHLSIDSWTLAYVGKHYFRGKKPTARQVEKVYKRFDPWQQLVWWFEQWGTWATARSMGAAAAG